MSDETEKSVNNEEKSYRDKSWDDRTWGERLRGFYGSVHLHTPTNDGSSMSRSEYLGYDKKDGLASNATQKWTTDDTTTDTTASETETQITDTKPSDWKVDTDNEEYKKLYKKGQIARLVEESSKLYNSEDKSEKEEQKVNPQTDISKTISEKRAENKENTEKSNAEKKAEYDAKMKEYDRLNEAKVARLNKERDDRSEKFSELSNKVADSIRYGNLVYFSDDYKNLYDSTDDDAQALIQIMKAEDKSSSIYTYKKALLDIAYTALTNYERFKDDTTLDELKQDVINRVVSGSTSVSDFDEDSIKTFADAVVKMVKNDAIKHDISGNIETDNFADALIVYITPYDGKIDTDKMDKNRKDTETEVIRLKDEMSKPIDPKLLEPIGTLPTEPTYSDEYEQEVESNEKFIENYIGSTAEDVATKPIEEQKRIVNDVYDAINELYDSYNNTTEESEKLTILGKIDALGKYGADIANAITSSKDFYVQEPTFTSIWTSNDGFWSKVWQSTKKIGKDLAVMGEQYLIGSDPIISKLYNTLTSGGFFTPKSQKLKDLATQAIVTACVTDNADKLAPQAFALVSDPKEGLGIGAHLLTLGGSYIQERKENKAYDEALKLGEEIYEKIKGTKTEEEYNAVLSEMSKQAYEADKSYISKEEFFNAKNIWGRGEMLDSYGGNLALGLSSLILGTVLSGGTATLASMLGKGYSWLGTTLIEKGSRGLFNTATLNTKLGAFLNQIGERNDNPIYVNEEKINPIEEEVINLDERTDVPFRGIKMNRTNKQNGTVYNNGLTDDDIIGYIKENVKRDNALRNLAKGL